MNDWPSFLGLPLWVWLFVIPSLFVLSLSFWAETAKKTLRPIWQILDKIYLAGGVISAVFMILILLIIVIQMIARWTGLTFEGSTEFAGYAMAATSFFAMAYTLNRGAHIRVSIFLNINHFTTKWLDVFAMFVASLIATYFARFAIKTNFMSEMLNDRTQGQDQVPESLLTFFEMFITAPSQWAALWENTGSEWVYTPVWLPQIPMSVGTVLLAIALWDNLSRLLVHGETSIKSETIT